MLTIGILFLLAIAIYSGYRRGFLLQIVYTVGYILSLIFAHAYYLTLAKKLEYYIPYPSATADTKFVLFEKSLNFDLDQAFYAGCAYLFLFLIGFMVTKFIAIFFKRVTEIPVIKQGNGLAGAVLNFFVMYVGIFFCLYIGAMFPVDKVQTLYQNSALAQTIVKKTPYFSQAVYEWWIKAEIPKAK